MFVWHFHSLKGALSLSLSILGKRQLNDELKLDERTDLQQSKGLKADM